MSLGSSLWARSAFSLSFITHNVRASPGRTSCPEPDYTAPNGLQFDVECGSHIPSANLYDDPFPGDYNNVKECIDACSLATQAPCFGVSYHISSGDCFFKNSSVSTASVTPRRNDDWNSAVANAEQLENTDTSCGYQNGTTQTTPNGEEFDIICNTDMGGHDSLVGNGGGYWPLHADSLAECMDMCSHQQLELCAAVAYNPGMEHGYGNCYPKLVKNGSRSYGGGIAKTHLAIAKPPTIDFTCRDKSTMNLMDSLVATTYCDYDRAARDLVIYHKDNMTSCVDSCAEWPSQNSTCHAVVFDSKMEKGYQNCYLKAEKGNQVVHVGFANAVLAAPQSSSSVSVSDSRSGLFSSRTRTAETGTATSTEGFVAGSTSTNSVMAISSPTISPSDAPSAASPRVKGGRSKALVRTVLGALLVSAMVLELAV
ncbi:hypothetical protein K402DRAFT_273489 [Aulographum hederae CBS 113979]|uniref:Uncharacterized protein n=1 Tax=Aulographum hederae CBS 113979 TaxID=1176131 RepID=A0A6G1H8U8_9PEZI|nr:hypothetical protein K402DRAFT_273489 [Aulographum hederae CBS 113979]